MAFAGVLVAAGVAMAFAIRGTPPGVSSGFSATPTATEAALPSDKQARVDYMASLQALSTATPSKDPDAGRVTLPPEESPFSPYQQVPAGDGFIVQSDLGPPGKRDAVYNNDWYEITEQGITEVYAGGSQTSPEIGFIDVVSWQGDHETIVQSGKFETPTRHGALTITGASGDTLVLRASDGTTFEFSVSTLSFD
jgi:hypothetical protein